MCTRINRRHALLTLVLLLFTVIAPGCHLIFPYESSRVEVKQAYLCESEIYRALGNGEEFTEEWRLWEWSTDPNTVPITCQAKLGAYLATQMAPGFHWQWRNFQITSATGSDPFLAKSEATDCTDVAGPPAYGGPLGADILWIDPDLVHAKAIVWGTTNDGEPVYGEVGIEKALVRFAQRGGLYDSSEIYVPGLQHTRMFDVFLELEDFTLAEVTFKNWHIQGIGMVLARTQSTAATTSYKIGVGDAKLYVYTYGEQSGGSGYTSDCFVSNDLSADGGVQAYQGAPFPFFNLSMDLSAQSTGLPLNLFVRVTSPSGELFNEHQPYVGPITITEVGPSSVTLDTVLTDHDGDLARVLWFENFEQPGEVFLGSGTPLTNIPLADGDHEVTAVVYDQRGAYGVRTAQIALENTPPVAMDDVYDVDEDQLLLVEAPSVLANDSDADDDTLSANPVSEPTNGVLSIMIANGAFLYRPGDDFCGVDAFDYVAHDGTDQSAPATVNITINCINDPPSATPDSYATDEDTLLTVGAPGVLTNDVDVEGDPLTANLAANPASGLVTLNADGGFTYEPETNFCGTDGFSYIAGDGAATSAPAEVTLAVTCVNDPPLANDDMFEVEEDGELNVPAPGVLANDTDVEGSALSAVLGTGPSHGSLALASSGAFVYTPAPNFFGMDAFTYNAFDGALPSNSPATVTLNVLEVAPEEEAARLVDEIDALVDAGELSDGHATALNAKLANVIAQIAKGKTNTACNVLNAFVNQVTDLMNSGVLSASEGQVLIDKVDNLRAELGCR